MNIPLPSRGDDILSWARSITAGVNAIAPIGGRGTLVKESANGFGFEGLPENKREKKVNASQPHNGLFELVSVVDTGGYHASNPDDLSPGPYTVTLKNTYYTVAGRILALQGNSLSMDMPGIIALEINAGDADGQTPDAQLVSYEDMSELSANQLVRTKLTTPLYLFDSSGSVIADFRIGPLGIMWEKGV